MEVDRPAPGEELNPGEATTPRKAATVILLRGGEEALEVLLVQRHPQLSFMGGAWVFPGGAVGRDDGAGEDALRATARRELQEEAGIDLGAEAELVKFSRWITPAMVKVRFDTHFYLAQAPDGVEPRADGTECVDARWRAPAAALAEHREGDLELVFPTIKQLEQLSGFGTAAELLAAARGREVQPVEPRVVLSGEVARILLPGEPGYDG